MSQDKKPAPPYRFIPDNNPYDEHGRLAPGSDKVGVDTKAVSSLSTQPGGNMNWIYFALYILGAFQSATLAMVDVDTHPVKVMLVSAFWPLDAIHTIGVMIYTLWEHRGF